MTAENEVEIKALDEKITDAEANLGESEHRSVHIKFIFCNPSLAFAYSWNDRTNESKHLLYIKQRTTAKALSFFSNLGLSFVLQESKKYMII